MLFHVPLFLQGIFYYIYSRVRPYDVCEITCPFLRQTGFCVLLIFISYLYFAYFYNMAGISFKLQGLDKVLASIDSYSNKVQDQIDDTLTGAAEAITETAKQLAPTDDSNLHNNIGYVNEPFAKALYSNAAYSAYIEFGTGANVDVPNIEGMDLPAYAMTFFVNGKGRIRPHPFFFPAVQQETKKLPGIIEKILKNTKP